MRACFNERAGNPILQDPNGGPDIEITPAIEDMLAERNNGFYVHLNNGLGLQFSNMGDYLSANDAYNIRDWPNTPYDKIPTDIPQDIHSAAVMTQMLTGYSALYSTQKMFLESSFRPTVGNPDHPYGYMQMTPDAVREGAEQLLKLPTADLILELVPELEMFSSENAGSYSTLMETDVINMLREDPLASTLLSSGYNIRYSQSSVEQGIEIGAVHGYLLHYLGPGNFPRITQAHAENPDGLAFEALRGGAESRILNSEANQAIFFKEEADGTLTPRTLDEMFTFLEEDKNLHEHPIMRTSIAEMECVEILTGQDANDRAAEVQRPENFVPTSPPTQSMSDLTN